MHQLSLHCCSLIQSEAPPEMRTLRAKQVVGRGGEESSPFLKSRNQLQAPRIIFTPSLERDKIFNSLQYQSKLFA